MTPDENSSILASGIAALDDRIGGFRKQDLVVLIGRPGSGKTSLALEIAINVAGQQKKPIAYFSPSMDKQQLLLRLITLGINRGMSSLNEGITTIMDWDNLALFAKQMSESQIVFDDRPLLSGDSMAAEIQDIRQDHSGLDLVFIDSLFDPRLGKKALKPNSKKTLQSLKAVAVEYDLAIMAIAHWDLRKLYDIEKYADLVLLLKKSKDSPRELNIVKNKHGQTGLVRCE